jgi:prephenate dehydrogenase
MSEEDGFALEKSTLAIVGLGLMGGSLALALKDRCASLMAVDTDERTCREAMEKDVVSEAECDPAAILPRADVVILAVPIPAILDLLARMDEIVPQPCIVLDLGSTKQAIVQAMDQLPDRFATLGGHPICGKEQLSLANASPDLYRNAPFVLTPPKRSSAKASSAAFQIISALGANPLWMDAAVHDRILASTSHLPFLLASVLVLATSSGSAPLVGPGFRSASRLASTPSSMMLGVLQTNRENILSSLSRFREHLDLIESALQAGDSQALLEILDRSRERHQIFK